MTTPFRCGCGQVSTERVCPHCSTPYCAAAGHQGHICGQQPYDSRLPRPGELAQLDQLAAELRAAGARPPAELVAAEQPLPLDFHRGSPKRPTGGTWAFAGQRPPAPPAVEPKPIQTFAQLWADRRPKQVPPRAVGDSWAGMPLDRRSTAAPASLGYRSTAAASPPPVEKLEPTSTVWCAACWAERPPGMSDAEWTFDHLECER